MDITVHLASAVDASLTQTLASLGVTLKPLHPGVGDADLAGQFFARVPDAAADDICARLLAHPAVVAAYPKPAGSPPDGIS